MRTVHVVVPDDIDDPSRPSGGNSYDRHLCRMLGDLGWSVRQHLAPGAWPDPDAEARDALSTALRAIPDEAVVLLDGLVASGVPEVLLQESTRLRLVVLLHMSVGGERECAALSAARAIVTTSEWSRDLLARRFSVPGGRIQVASPGVEKADPADGTETGGELLCVAAVIREKGHDLLLAALAGVVDRPWHLVCVGATDREPHFVELLLRQARETGMGDRVTFAGAQTGSELAGSYAAADALVLASRNESYCMVVTEALARGLPVIATSVGGLPEALGVLPGGRRPGLLVPEADAPALGRALSRWLDDRELRQRLRQNARERRTGLPGWGVTADRVSRVLEQVAR